ncbi:hypothetical protein C8J56DRAFT_936441 [Mycena floridula]|nr:hypothetical protein C8J56DRAFT_936441 [Mycena floridula]
MASQSPEVIEVIDLTELTESSGGESESEESASEADVPIDQTSREQLHAAIATASEDRLRAVLATLVDQIPAAEQAAIRELVTLKRKTREVVPRWKTCVNCDGEFDAQTKRKEAECVFHPGELEADESKFVDWDEDCHGPMDTLDNRSDFPENFTWSCCEGDGSSDGCVKRQHTADGYHKKRRI